MSDFAHEILALQYARYTELVEVSTTAAVALLANLG